MLIMLNFVQPRQTAIRLYTFKNYDIKACFITVIFNEHVAVAVV